MKVLDLFAGLGGATQAFRERGHEVVGVELDADRLNNPVQAPWDTALEEDVFNLTAEDLREHGPYDFVWASPPCTTFSVMTFGHYWHPDGEPSKGLAWKRCALVQHTLAIIRRLQPRAWIMENPVGALRKQRFMQPHERRTITYCQYGTPYMKPTDLWGGFPPTLTLNARCQNGDTCHEAAPRGNLTGVQGVRKSSLSGSAAERSLVPHELSLAVCAAMEAWDGAARWSDHAPRLSDFVEVGA